MGPGAVKWPGSRGQYLHLIPLLVIWQDLGYIPVPRGDGLYVVIAAVGLEHRWAMRTGRAGPDLSSGINVPGESVDAITLPTWSSLWKLADHLAHNSLSTSAFQWWGEWHSPDLCCLSESSSTPWLPPQSTHFRRRINVSYVADTVTLKFVNPINGVITMGDGEKRKRNMGKWMK